MKRFTASVLVLLALLVVGAAALSPADPTKPSQLIITASENASATISAESGGGIVSIPLGVTNPASDITNVIMTVSNISSLPFDITATAKCERVGANGSNIQFYVTANQLTKPGKYALELSATYTANYMTFETAENGYPISGTMSTTIEKANFTYYVEIVNSNYDAFMNGAAISVVDTRVPDAVSSNDEFTIALDLENLLTIDLNNVKVTLSPGQFMFKDDTDSKTVPIRAKGLKTVSWNLIAPKITENATVQLTLTIAYTDGEGNNASKTYYVAINAYKDASGEIPSEKPELKITSVTMPDSVKAGDDFDVVVKIANRSEYDATGVSLSLTPEGTIDSLTALSLPQYKSQVIKAGEEVEYKVSYNIKDNSADGYIIFTADIVYKSGGDDKSDRLSGGIKITSVEPAKLKVVSYSMPDKAKPGDVLSLKVTIKNESAETACKNIKISISPASGITCMSANPYIVDTLEPGATTTVTFELRFDENAADGFNNIGVTVDGVEYNTGTTVTNPKKTGDTPADEPKPTIIIESYDFGGDFVYGGADFTLTLSIRNTSSTTTVKNMKITVSSGSDKGGAVFTPVSSSNTFFVESLAPKGLVTKTIVLNVRADAEPKSNSLIVNIESDNGKSGSDEITIPVRQELKFNMNTPSSIGTITMQDEGYLSVGCTNTGKSTIYNVYIRVSGDGFIASESEYFAGNIESGSGVSKEFYLTPTMPGEITGTINYEYEDSTGQKFTDSQEFNFTVIESYDSFFGGDTDVFDPGVIDDPLASGDQGEGGIPVWVWIAAGGAAVVIVAVIIIVAAKKKKAKNDEEDW